MSSKSQADPLAPLVDLPGVAEASEAARAAVARAHRHRVNLRGWPESAAEASVRAARASSVLDGGSLSMSADGQIAWSSAPCHGPARSSRAWSGEITWTELVLGA